METSVAQSIGPSTSPRRYWPYWCIHGQLYDLRPWTESHPGGAEFLRLTLGTDCTAGFELHHLRRGSVTTAMARYVIGPASELPEPQFDWQGYGQLRERVLKRLQAANWRPGPTRRSVVVGILALLFCLATPFLWQYDGAYDGLVKAVLAIAYVEAFIIFGGLGHIFLHQNSPLVVLGDLFSLSTHEWRQTHCLEHHTYTNHPELDGNVGVFAPVIHFAPGYRARLEAWSPLLLLPLYAVSFMLLRIMRVVHMVKDPRRLGVRIPLYLIGSYGWLALWWTQGDLLTGLLLECAVSFVFCFLTMSNHNHADCHGVDGTKDFVAYQIETTRDFGSTNYWASLFGGYFLGTQTLHHLFPTLDPQYLPLVDQELHAMGYQRQVSGIGSHHWHYLTFTFARPSHS